MSVHQAVYKFGPNDTLRFWDNTTNPASLRSCKCHQAEIKIFKKPDDTIVTKVSYLIVVDGKNTTLKVDGTGLQYIGVGGEILYDGVERRADYKFAPDQGVWVVDRQNTSVAHGTVYQVEIKVHRETETTSHTKISYYVRYNDTTGTVIRDEADVFGSSSDAWTSLGVDFGPTPTPTAPPGSTPLPGSAGSTTVSKVNGESLTIFRGQPVYIMQDTGKVGLVKNDETILTFLGFVHSESIPPGGSGLIITEGSINNTITNWNNIVGGASGLTVGARYYIAETAGYLTSSAPSSRFVKQIGIAVSAEELDIRTNATIKLYVPPTPTPTNNP